MRRSKRRWSQMIGEISQKVKVMRSFQNFREERISDLRL
jgi:hypothetical protein